MSLTTKEIGQLGEEIGCRYLKSNGFSVVERNYLKKWGEIDIVANRRGKTHFVEVKTVTHMSDISTRDRRRAGEFPENKKLLNIEDGEYRPEENVHLKKLERMRRVIRSYLLEKGEECDWQFDVLTIVLDIKEKTARCKFLKDIIL